MGKRHLITGVGGFVASHLARYLLSQGEEVIGTIRWNEDLSRLDGLKIKTIPVDLTDLSACIRCMEKCEPDYIYHLAAQSYVTDSFENPIATLKANVEGSVNLFEAVRLTMIDPIIYVASSSEVYGDVTAEESPIKETNEFRPANPYAASKVAVDAYAFMYWKYFGLKIIRTRWFTHSVSRWSPVIVKDNRSGMIDIKYISEIRQAIKKGGYASGKLEGDTQIWDLHGRFSIWSDDGWQVIKHLSCHPINGHKLLRVACRGSIYEVTDNHSILDSNGKEKIAGESKRGDDILQASLPHHDVMELSPELAWLYGLFVAEGSSGDGQSGRTFDFRIANTKIDLLERAQDIICRYWGKASTIRLERERPALYRLDVYDCRELAGFLHSDFYASDRNKRIPFCILNASKEIKLEFLRGYNAGDGRQPLDCAKWGKHQEFIGFKTKSPILALGLCYLVENTTGQRYSLNVENREGRCYYELSLNSLAHQNMELHKRKSLNTIKSIEVIPYDGEVWDVETENHHFHCGIGKGIVHNTGPGRTMMSFENSFARQIALIEAGKQEPVIQAGNLASVRTIADVRDAVRGIYFAVQKCQCGEVYNIGGNTTKSVGEVLEYLISLSPRKDDIEIEIDPSLLRKADVNLQIPCCDKFKEVTKWEPEIPFETTMLDVLQFWREVIYPHCLKMFKIK